MSLKNFFFPIFKEDPDFGEPSFFSDLFDSEEISSKNGSKTILIQHGNFFTVYKNLSDIYVKKGDKVSTKQELGQIITNKSSGQTILSFSLFRDNKTENPLLWIGKK